jgi:hypothetical protein
VEDGQEEINVAVCLHRSYCGGIRATQRKRDLQSVKVQDQIVPVRKMKSELVSLELKYLRRSSFHSLFSYPTFLLLSTDSLIFT